jgi:hypothetical protein
VALHEATILAGSSISRPVVIDIDGLSLEPTAAPELFARKRSQRQKGIIVEIQDTVSEATFYKYVQSPPTPSDNAERGFRDDDCRLASPLQFLYVQQQGGHTIRRRNG